MTPGATPTRPPDWIDPEDIPSDDPPPSILPGPTPAFDITQVDPTDDGWLNVLLTGLDWLPGRTSARTDTMIVVSVNSATGDVYMFSFPRDTAQFPVYNGGLYNGKLNTFAGHSKDDPVKFPEPGQPALAYEIGYLLGIPIDYYASINMLGFMSLVDEVGSITVCNERQISDDHMQFYLSPGLHTLDSADALRFVRSRHGSSDFARARRQQQALTALRAEILKPQNLARLPDIVQALSGVINTNFPPNQVDQLIGLANQVSATPTAQYVFGFPEWAQHLPRIDTNGRSVQFLKLDKLAALSLQVFGDKSLYNDPGAAPSDLPTLLPTPSPAPSDGGTVC
jgi:LCP family protein required for cell wall assembly